jgi:hypothetical protein
MFLHTYLYFFTVFGLGYFLLYINNSLFIRFLLQFIDFIRIIDKLKQNDRFFVKILMFLEVKR